MAADDPIALEPMLRDDSAAAEVERIVAWLRLPAIVLVALSARVDRLDVDRFGFYLGVVVFSAWALGVVAWVHRRPPGALFALTMASVDIAAITVLAYMSGGAFSSARLAYALVPISLAFRFRPELTVLGGCAVILAYLAQALGRPAAHESDVRHFIALQSGYLIWITAASALLSWMLARRTRRIAELALRARHLLNDSMGVEERERQRLAELLHDGALQNLLSARHDLQELDETLAHPALARAESVLTETVGQMRAVVADLHPLVLEQAGLEAALSALATWAARRGRFAVTVSYASAARPEQERLLFAAARELLTNVAKHARAGNVEVRCDERDGLIELSVLDDGVGFDISSMDDRLADGHIGLASQRARVEVAGGDLTVVSEPGRGTTATVRLPVPLPDAPAPGAAASARRR
jgi:two-component system NarL family sensor kinase